MNTTRIYIICTYNAGGRYVQTGTTDANRAGAEAARLADDYAAAGWNLTETQTIPDSEQPERIGPGFPAVIQVLHLRNAAGDWCNIEVYRVEENTK